MLNSILGWEALGLLGGQRLVAPSAPTGLAVTGISGGVVADTTPEFTTDALPEGVASLEFEYGAFLTGTPTITGIAVPAYTVPSAQANYGSYVVSVRSRGANGLASDWVTAVAYRVEVNSFLDSFTSGGVGTGTRTADSGYEKIVDTNSINSIASGELVVNGTPAASDGIIGSNSDGTATKITRAAGRCVRFTFKQRTSIGSKPRFGFSGGVLTSGGVTIGGAYESTTSIKVGTATGAAYFRTVNVGSGDQSFVCMMRSTGGRFIMRDGSGVPELLYYYRDDSTDQYWKARQTIAAASNYHMDDVRVFDVAFGDTDDMIVNTTPTSAQVYAASATGHFHQGVTTLPASPSANMVAAELRYQHSAIADDYIAYRLVRNAGNTAWDVTAVEVTAGVDGATVQATVAGVGTPDRLVVICRGTTHEFFTEASGVPTQRGATQTNTTFQDNSGVAAIWDAGTTIGSLDVLGLTSALYNPCFQSIPPQTYPATDAGALQQLIDENANPVLTQDYDIDVVAGERIILPSNRVINFNGYTVKDSTSTDADAPAFADKRWVFEIPNGATQITMYGGIGDGNHVSNWTNKQQAFIGGIGSASYITIHDMVIKNQVGFYMAMPGGDHWETYNNTYINCGNGNNVHARDSRHHHNSIINSEGHEIAAANVEIDHNTYNPALHVAVSIGGNVGGTALPGMHAHHETILGVTSGGGIVVADGCRSAIVEYCTLDSVEGEGITVLASTGFSSTTEDTIIRYNTVGNCDNSAFKPAYVSGRVTGTEIYNNTALPGNGQYGLNCQTSDANIHDNDFRGAGATYDVYLPAASAGVTFAQPPDADANLYDTIQDLR